MSTPAWVGFVVMAALGAVSRYSVDNLVAERLGRAFPWGVLLINATGSLLLGFLTGLALYHGLPKTSKVILGTGFCGAYTTFSTFAVDTVAFGDQHRAKGALANALGTLVLCAGMAALGLALAAL